MVNKIRKIKEKEMRKKKQEKIVICYFIFLYNHMRVHLPEKDIFM